MNTFSNNLCPKCGKAMLQGYLIGGIKHYLHWFPEGKKPDFCQSLKLGWPFGRPGSAEKGMLLHPAIDGICYLPALNCPDCKLVLLDYDEEHMME